MAIDSASRLTSLKIKLPNGSFTNEIPISAFASNIIYDPSPGLSGATNYGYSLIDVLGSVTMTKGSLQAQINNLYDGLNAKLESAALASVPSAVTEWLNQHYSSGGTTVTTDKSLTTQNIPADAKAAGSIVKINSNQPNQEANKIWIKPSVTSVTVPTMQDIENIVAPQYSNSSPYNIGDYVIHDDLLYKCTTAIGSSGESWTAAHWTAVKVGSELSNLKSASVHGTNQNLTSTTGTDICNDDLNNLPLNVVYGLVPYSGLTHMPYTETGSEYGGIIFSVSKQYPANATATQILIRRDGHVFTRQYWNSWESWFEYVTYSEITALVDNYVDLAFFGSEQNITSTTVQSICSGDANNLPNNRIMGINIAYNGITNLPTDYPDGIKSKYGGCVITFGKQSSRGYGDTQIFVGYGSQTYIRVYTGSWQNWRCLSTQKFNNIVGVGDSICEGWRNYNKGFVGWLNVPYTNLGVTGATLGFAAGHTQIYTEIENITYTKDVIISDGGINDYYFDVPLGDQPTRPVTNDTEASSIDKSTVSGGLSYLCYLMIKKMPKAQRYFLITHKTNNYPYTANGAGYTQQQLHDRIVEVCKLYNVHIIDVYEQSIINSAFSQYVSPTAYASDTSVTTQYYVDSDGIHPLALGYQEGYYPIIRQALQSATTKI